MTKVSIFASIALMALGMSCAGDEKAPRGKGTGKKPPPAPATRPVRALSSRTRPATATSPSATQVIAMARKRAKIHDTHTRMTVVAMALDMFEIDIGRYPTAKEGLEALVKKPEVEDEAVAGRWRGPYLKRMPKDAWGKPFHYELAEDRRAGSPYRLWSAGPDGVS